MTTARREALGLELGPFLGGATSTSVVIAAVALTDGPVSFELSATPFFSTDVRAGVCFFTCDVNLTIAYAFINIFISCRRC